MHSSFEVLLPDDSLKLVLVNLQLLRVARVFPIAHLEQRRRLEAHLSPTQLHSAA